MVTKDGPFWQLYEQLKNGQIGRRDFIQQSSTLGIGMPIILFVLNAVKIKSTESEETQEVGKLPAEVVSEELSCEVLP